MSLRRENYDPQVRRVFDIVGSYFVDVMYNYLYLLAKHNITNSNGMSTTLTDEYRNLLQTYAKGATTHDAAYKNMIGKLHEYYRKYTTGGALNFAEFEDRVLKQFVPPDDFTCMTNKQKDGLLYTVITNSIKKFCLAILAPEVFRQIIDDHFNTDNVAMLQEVFINVLIDQREQLLAQFSQKVLGGTASDAALSRVRQYAEEQCRLRLKIESDLESAMRIIQALTKKIAELEARLDAHTASAQTVSAQSLATLSAPTPSAATPQVQSAQVMTPSVTPSVASSVQTPVPSETPVHSVAHNAPTNIMDDIDHTPPTQSDTYNLEKMAKLRERRMVKFNVDDDPWGE